MAETEQGGPVFNDDANVIGSDGVNVVVLDQDGIAWHFNLDAGVAKKVKYE